LAWISSPRGPQILAFKKISMVKSKFQENWHKNLSLKISFKGMKSYEHFLIEYGHVGYQKIPHLMQIQKPTYLSVKMDVKKVTV
jgi:hypothetical protein